MIQAKLKKILIKSKKEAFSELIGNNSSKLKGEGYDFCELKEYESGEDVKNIDWVISAKMQKPYVKLFHIQKELNITLIPILNATVHFGTDEFKQELICKIASTLAFSSIKQGDSFCSYIANEKVELCTKRSKRLFSVNSMAENIYNYNPLNKKVDYKKITNEIFKTIKKRSLIFLIGDFFNIDDLNLKLLSKKHEAFVIITRDQFEENLSSLGNINLRDLETNIDFSGLLNKQTIKEYKKRILENDHKLFEHLKKCAIKTTKIYTNEDSTSKLIGLLK